MIKQIIKRDGSVEDFSAEKINKWGEWAAQTLGKRVDWPSVVLSAVGMLPETCTSKQLQERLIKTCLEFDSWSYNRMAGRLYAALTTKEIFNSDKKPTIKELQSKLVSDGYMVELNFSDEEYAELEKVIDHKKDLKATYFEYHQIINKYALRDVVSNRVFETPQFTIMRMAMAVATASYFPEERKMEIAKDLYQLISDKILNVPTPNWKYLGTGHGSVASCALYTVGDDAKSLAIGDHIAYTLTCAGAGIGSHLQTRSLGDPVRGGIIQHQGKLPYYRAMVSAAKANVQAGRAGAVTTYYNAFDPEASTIALLKNPMSTEDKKIRGMDYNFGTTKFFDRKAAKGEDVFVFNSFTAPDLYDALYSDDEELFERLYIQYENNPAFKKEYVSARGLLLTALNEGFETGRHYLHKIDEINRHTPFKEKIYLSNLCAEIMECTKPYYDMRDLYSDELHERGEIALCNLAAINIGNVTSDEEYARAAYYALLMIDVTINESDWVFPHLTKTAKARMNAGVGITGLAYYMAKNRQRYNTVEGKIFIHEIAETHYWHLLNASLRLAKEFGNAQWMHKTKWPEGYLPLDTYNRNVDTIANFELKRDWESLRQAIIENGGIRNSVLCAYMPCEASSVAAGTANSIYPIRELTLIKSDDNKTTYWAAPEGDKIGYWYDIAWDIDTEDMIDVYAIFQKFCDQGISADFWRRIGAGEMVSSTEMLRTYFYMSKMGMKTRYYQNSETMGIQNVEKTSACSGETCDV